MGFFDFFKKTKTYDSDGFDAQGYNRLGFDRMGYDQKGYDIHGFDRKGYNVQGIYKITGRDADGYDANGYDVNGFNRLGIDARGFNLQGRDCDGFDRNGFDAEGYNRDGFDKSGISRDGFDREGYDREGWNREGYNRKGFDKDGYNKDGFDKRGFDREGYNLTGYDRKGYNRSGYNKDGYNKSGYDCDGYDKSGYNAKGYNRAGYNKSGYDKDGYNSDGYNKDGIDRDGYDAKGFNKAGRNRAGFDRDGYDADGYDEEGYNRKGFNREGMSKMGFRIEEFDNNGYHKITGLDAFGYSKYGYNINGINKFTGRDRLGFDSEGLDENGFNIWGFNMATRLDILGNSIAIYEGDKNMAEDVCAEFERCYYEYMAGKTESAINLASRFCYGKGTVRDYRKALRILVDVALEHQCMDAIRDLADHYYVGDIIGQNIPLSNYLNDIVKNNKTFSINQYKARQAIEFQRPVDTTDVVFREEVAHLEKVLESLKYAIFKCETGMYKIDSHTSWMDSDQREDWREKKARNIELGHRIITYERIEKRPYYARMDAVTNGRKHTFYIGEEPYDDYSNPACDVISVWSEVGKRYRDTSNQHFYIKNHSYDVKLRRKLRIASGNLAEYFDEYIEGSEAAQAEITNPFLIKILEEKRGEKNITNIIRSIQQNQNEIIEADFNSNLIVQGCAGSGKTMILLHRLANMKYNRDGYDWSKVKIITPNKDFTLFIDELSRNLKIDEIEKITLQDYLLEILQKYAFQYSEKNPKENDSKNSGQFSIGNERKKLRDDGEIERPALAFIYSEDFYSKISKKAEAVRDEIETYRQANEAFAEVFHDLLDKNEIKYPRRSSNYTVYLYARILFLYFIFGSVRNTEKMLCIDEGQDISEWQYKLLYEVNGKSTYLNIYGDLMQRIPENVSISSWDSLKKMISASYYELNENYRNSENIIDYYGKILKIHNGSFGLKTKDVEQFDREGLDILLKLQLLLGNRTVVISNSENTVPPNVLSLCRKGGIGENQISIMTVKQVKGLEFDTAFVFDEGMDKNERYIAYSRALSELYVSSNVPGSKKKALDVINECKGVEEHRLAVAQGNRLEEDEIDDEEECASIADLQNENVHDLLIVVRNTWTNDFCFVVEEFDGPKARGRQFLNGNLRRKASYGKDLKEFYIYSGPSRNKIENQYE